MKNCDTQLAELRKEASIFFNGFEPVHDVSNAYVADIQRIYGALNTALGKYASNNFGEGLSTDQLRSEMKYFSDIFFFLEIEAWDIIHRVEQKIFELNEMIRCFKIKNNLTCQRRSSSTSSCEAELNKLRCDLTEFLSDVEKGFDRALVYLGGLAYTCTFLSKQTRNFYTNNQIACGPSCSNSDRELRRNTKNYFASFNSEQVLKAHDKLENLASDSNALVDSIHAWQAQLS